ncbi:uncharacterized protein LOC119007094 isoform X1 [Acanthopagrus latus]|uniref:uncharacterized protein LOC119007094 isoform X1 n=1 Tax=Acanthopagrus latus TaxID=8177 RepID=UPI00187C2870|nr:uncharacterized protein LOC119007094 isoform X1 [Acanthopagrus latus]
MTREACCTTMIGGLAALILLSTEHLVRTAEVPQQISLTVVHVGGNVTLKCSDSKENKFFYWYKLPLGYTVQTIAVRTHTQLTLSEQFKNPRFSVKEGEGSHFLSIRNVSKDDEATYFCQTGSVYSVSFVNDTFLVVKDRDQQKSVKVEQSPAAASVQPGHAVTLRCSLHPRNKEDRVQCPGERSVFWFRAGSGGSHPSIIYPQSNSSCDREDRSCVYSLSKTVRDSSDNGTYYCAVVTCGEILFGEGTKVNTRSEVDPVVSVLGVLLACCVSVITVLIFCVCRRRVCEHCKAGAGGASHHPGHDGAAVDQSPDLDGDAEAVNYAALDFSSRKVKRATKKKKKSESPQECVYSAVRAEQHTRPRPHL